MDSGSSQSVAAANEAKTKPPGPSSSVPAPQIQPPITVMMQQAIAMQQFQFQQALLMQQVMASQQAAARAATVKSAAEMAAARAAEISKQLKGVDGGEENEKTVDHSASRSKSRSGSQSGSRSRSRSPSCSRSRSRSQTKSRSRSRTRSPVRYRRDRSISGSPLRYRRDRYSPPRYRYYHRYQSHSHSRYRGYYRGGYGDYSWNYYRREWDRDRFRDHHSYRGRRSRSRSRSRSISKVRRRSITHSQSPNYHRDHSISPRHQTKDGSAGHRPRKSRSREAKHSPLSRSLSVSRERGSVKRQSRDLEEGSLRPDLKVRDNSDHQELHSTSVDNEGSLGWKSSPCSSRAERNEDVDSSTHRILQDSPVRSLSVSLDRFKSQKENFEDDGNSIRHKRLSSRQHEKDVVVIEAEERRLNMEEQEGEIVKLQLSTTNSEKLAMGIEGHNKGNTFLSLSSDLLREPDSWSERFKRKELSGNLESSDAEMEDGEELDDWRNDIKAYEKEKALRKESRKEAAKKEQDFVAEVVCLDSKLHSFQPHTDSSLDKIDGNRQQKGQIALDGIGQSHNVHCRGDGETGLFFDARNSFCMSNHSPEAFGDKDIEQQFGPSRLKHPVEGNDKNGLHKTKYVDYKADAGCEDTKSCEPSEEDRDADLIYEGPVIAPEEFAWNLQQVTPLKDDTRKEATDSEYISGRVNDDDVTTKHGTSNIWDAHEEKSKRRKEIAVDHTRHKRKGRERSAGKGDLKRDNEEREKHRDRNKRHKRKHRGETIAELEDDDSSVSAEGHRGKRRHKRRHRKDDEAKKEKKKRRHRRRVKDSSCSHSQSLSPGWKDKAEMRRSNLYHKSSSRHKKRSKGASKGSSESSFLPACSEL